MQNDDFDRLMINDIVEIEEYLFMLKEQVENNYQRFRSLKPIFKSPGTSILKKSVKKFRLGNWSVSYLSGRALNIMSWAKL